MSNKKSNDSRRKLLKSIAAGSGAVVAGKSLPESWSKPVINSVMLPAHASTTDDSGTSGGDTTTTAAPTWYSDTLSFIQTDTQNSLLEDALSVLVQNAHACCSATQGSMCVDTSNAPTFKAQVLVTDGQTSALHTGSGTIGGGPAKLIFSSGCDWFDGVSIAVSTPGENGAGYTVRSGDEIAKGTAPAGQNCPSEPGDCPG